MSETILEVRNLKKHFVQRKGLLSRLQDKESKIIPAVDGISFYLKENETLGLVGESGCGKTTTGKAILKLSGITSGEILFKGTDITNMGIKEFRPYRSEIQMIFQDLDAALNPKIRVQAILEEAVRTHHKNLHQDAVIKRVHHLMELVNLKKNKLSSFPSELSGGEKRRVGIARVLAVEPKLIVADEPTSALDVSIQAQVINLLRDLQNKLGLSYVFISHDLQLVELISNKVAVMYLGRIVEMGQAKDVAQSPRHPYTAILWSSLVDVKSDEHGEDQAWGVFDFERPASGCRFAPRCPVYAKRGKPDICTDADNEPMLTETRSGQYVACHFPLD